MKVDVLTSDNEEKGSPQPRQVPWPGIKLATFLMPNQVSHAGLPETEPELAFLRGLALCGWRGELKTEGG